MAKIILDSEKELEDWIAEQMREGPRCPFFGKEPDYKDVFQQLRIGNYGVADIVATGKFTDLGDGTEHDWIFVIEVKKGEIGANAYAQLHRYMKGLQVFVGDNVTIRGAIVGTEWVEDDCFMIEYCNGDAYLATFCLDTGLYLRYQGGFERTEKGVIQEKDFLEFLKADNESLSGLAVVK